MDNSLSLAVQGRVQQGSNIKQLSYLEKLIATFGNSIVSHYNIDEASGTTMTDAVNAHNATYANVTLASTPIFSKTSGLWGDTSYANFYPAAAAMNKDEITFIAWVKLADKTLWANNTRNRQIVGIRQTSPFSTIYFYKDPVNFGVMLATNRNGVALEVSSFELNTDGWIQVAFTCSVINNRIRGYLNGVPFLKTKEVTGFASWVGSWRSDLCGLGSNRGTSTENPWTGNIANVTTLNREATPEEILSIFSYPNVVFDGDSRFASKILPNCAVGSNTASVQCVAVAGRSLATCLSLASTNVDPLYRSGLKNIYVILAGINDASYGDSAVTIYNNLKAICLDRKAKGFYTIVCSDIDGQDASRNAVNWHTVIWPELLTLLRADHSWADGFADLGANVNLQDALNTTYFMDDKVHPNRLGCLEAAKVIDPVITALLS